MFEDAKVGDRVWDFNYGWGEIVKIDNPEPYNIQVEFDKCGRNFKYTTDGQSWKYGKQSLFWDEVKFEIPKKPFDVAGFLKRTVEPTEFVTVDGHNIYLSEHYLYSSKIEYKISCDDKVATVYLKVKNTERDEYKVFKDIVKILNKNKVTMDQIMKAYKELGWL